MYIIPIGIYALSCLMVAWIGRWSRLGFWGVVLFSMVFTPVVSLILVLFLSDRARGFFNIFNRSKSKEQLSDLTEAPSVVDTEQVKNGRPSFFTNIFKGSKSKEGTSDLTEAPLGVQTDQPK